MSRSSIALCAAFFGLILALPSLTYALDDPACKPLYEVSRKANLIPYHMYSTTVAGYNRNQPENSEMISTGGANGVIYVMVRGKWTRTRLTPGDLVKDKDEGASTAKNTCRYLRDEALNGEAASVYNSHSDTEVGKVDTTIWISKSKGLPLREDIDIDVGGSMGKSHKSIRFEYGNVHPPAGVQ